MIAAAREVREWAAGLIAQYENAVKRATGPVPAKISAHMAALRGKLAQADSQLRFGVDLAGQVSQGEPTPELHEEAENSLWDALQQFFLLNQAVALPGLLRASPSSVAGSNTGKPSKAYRDRPIHPNDLWRIAAPSARSELRGTRFGTAEMEEMCEKMGGMLTAGAQQYLDEVMQQRHGAMPLVLLRWQTAPLNRCTVHPVHSTLQAPIYLLATNSIGTSTGDMSSPSSGLAVCMVGRNVKSRESRVASS